MNDIERLEELIASAKAFAEWVRDASAEDLLTESEDRAVDFLESVENDDTND